ncbi:MAG: lipopolysaccharide heptosyltransferase II [Vicinamibacterales bacterium]|nr:lipopolysaccharide heptosyltransferase II [Vicinamibacterales bacterium]MDP6610062.1 lipopolysaccharide heptosyltransferase II [Vicinamibacterales bacterium]
MTDPARLVVVTPSWLGDIVMALPSIVALRRHFASSHLALALPRVMTSIARALSGSDIPNAVVPLDGGRAGVADDAARLADGGYDTAILFPNSFRSAWVVHKAAIAERWGYRADFRGWLLTRGIKRPKRGGHQADYYRALVSALGVSTGVADKDEAERIALVATDAHRARAASLLALEKVGADEPIVAIAPGAGHGHAKQWPPERFARLARRTSTELGRVVVLVGSTADRPAGRAIESALAEANAMAGSDAAGRVVNLVNLIGRTDLSALIGVLSGCDVCVSNDTGAMHLASALGRPVVALFGPSDERATAPLGPHELMMHPVHCRPCLLRDCPIDHRCMTGISTDDVFAALARGLTGSPQAVSQ